MNVSILFGGLLILNVVASEFSLSAEWEKFKQTHKKTYSSLEEEDAKRKVWEANSNFIQKHNKEADEGLHTFRVGMNQFGDLTSQEFSELMLSKMDSNIKRNEESKPLLVAKIPNQVDWRTIGCVAPVRDQGQGCNDEYAFNVADSVAGVKCVLTKTFQRLSEQQIIDCSRSFGNLGCQGGFYDQTYVYIIKTGGLESEQSYPFEGRDGPCRFNQEKVAVTIANYGEVQAGNETQLALAVANFGPIPVGIDAGESSFQFYTSGVYYDPNCSASQVDHLVLIVGYGVTKDNFEYYIVKNSWGTTWGEAGYVRMSRNRDNNCGISSFASYPIL